MENICKNKISEKSQKSRLVARQTVRRIHVDEVFPSIRHDNFSSCHFKDPWSHSPVTRSNLWTFFSHQNLTMKIFIKSQKKT